MWRRGGSSGGRAGAGLEERQTRQLLGATTRGPPRADSSTLCNDTAVATPPGGAPPHQSLHLWQKVKSNFQLFILLDIIYLNFFLIFEVFNLQCTFGIKKMSLLVSVY